jgi:hypothetical protein
MKEEGADRIHDSEITPAGDARVQTKIVVRTPGARVVSLDDARRTSDGPPWEVVENYLQSGKPSERLNDWQHRSPAFAGALHVLDSLEWPAGEPRSTGSTKSTGPRSSGPVASCILRSPSGR